MQTQGRGFDLPPAHRGWAIRVPASLCRSRVRSLFAFFGSRRHRTDRRFERSLESPHSARTSRGTGNGHMHGKSPSPSPCNRTKSSLLLRPTDGPDRLARTNRTLAASPARTRVQKQKARTTRPPAPIPSRCSP
ncbi:hypothetical protein K466DRAFT_585284 [Polyporus arcularius HHB13444]|uniref:Uncharacterized protein n=1 Tax=Polyporus arcularius HHB13444 TaxID=1314778 RepID=A0A5C3PHJ0_9APHY|nr:hypothetical protein K466DRAFT_585284 [Polyporus arcularius HHB13444]